MAVKKKRMIWDGATRACAHLACRGPQKYTEHAHWYCPQCATTFVGEKCPCGYDPRAAEDET